ncbi:unnamed protein product [Amoebophrya sp. A25]|nr:unnamed protein product [Amoebophrya sp. A25]|eukprot:GSA25T00021309001.1
MHTTIFNRKESMDKNAFSSNRWTNLLSVFVGASCSFLYFATISDRALIEDQLRILVVSDIHDNADQVSKLVAASQEKGSRSRGSQRLL